jgi:hypothetical protein
MFLAALILMLSTGLLFFYFEVTCRKILRRRSTQEYFQTIVSANRLEFPSVRRSIEEFNAPVDYLLLTVTLRGEFLLLTYLLKNAANIHQRCTLEERLLILYFRVVLFCLAMRHWLRWREAAAILKLTAILQYFANVVGERVHAVRFGSLAVSEFFNIE